MFGREVWGLLLLLPVSRKRSNLCRNPLQRGFMDTSMQKGFKMPMLWKWKLSMDFGCHSWYKYSKHFETFSVEITHSYCIFGQKNLKLCSNTAHLYFHMNLRKVIMIILKACLVANVGAMSLHWYYGLHRCDTGMLSHFREAVVQNGTL